MVPPPPDNKIQPDENQMVYAELGPGGGRTGPKPITEESNYAQVKTDGLYYPPLQQSSYRGPPKYFVANRDRNEMSPTHATDDYDDYADDVIV